MKKLFVLLAMASTAAFAADEYTLANDNRTLKFGVARGTQIILR